MLNRVTEDSDCYWRMTQAFYAAASKAFIFNMLDKNTFESGPLIVSHDKEEIYNQFVSICNNVILESGYLENDFIILMKKEI